MNTPPLLPTLLCGCALLATATAAQAQFSLSGELRPRAEYRHGYSTLPAPDADAAVFISQRSRLRFGYTTDDLTVGLTLQDVRVWGDEEQLKDEPSLGLHEAWADIALTDAISLKIGRQELVYDDHRLLGNVDWVQQGRSHDAALLRFRDNGWKVDLGGAYNQKTEGVFGTTYVPSNYKALGYLWVSRELSSSVRVSLIGITDGTQRTDSTDDIDYRYTYGGNGDFRADGFTAAAAVYGQSGTDRSGRTIAAYLAALSAGYRFDNIAVGAGIDYLSGTDMSETEQFTTFNTLYATNHKFYGAMDYFIVLPRDTKNGGLQDLYLTLQYSPTASLTLRVDGHHFSLAADVADPAAPGQALDKALGTEIDASAAYALTPVVSVQAGYSHMFATETMEAIKGGSKDETANWIWMMVSIKPTFFSK